MVTVISALKTFLFKPAYFARSMIFHETLRMITNTSCFQTNRWKHNVKSFGNLQYMVFLFFRKGNMCVKAWMRMSTDFSTLDAIYFQISTPKSKKISCIYHRLGEIWLRVVSRQQQSYVYNPVQYVIWVVEGVCSFTLTSFVRKSCLPKCSCMDDVR